MDIAQCHDECYIRSMHGGDDKAKMKDHKLLLTMIIIILLSYPNSGIRNELELDPTEVHYYKPLHNKFKL